MPDALERLTAALTDRYRIERELGAGGMATVYLAHDLKHDRKVAIKVLRPELAAVIGAERFLAEIKTTANLQHPHILGLLDSGEAAGLLYYVMPYVEGESLRDRLTREKQLPIAEAVRIATEVAAALDYAHRHNVIHRDIKPENILLHDGSALVADFGIALAASKAGGTRMTETGMSLGTPHYMSPEQAMGEREITARSDVYAVGALTYEMLVGDPPFLGGTAQAIVAKVLTEKPAPPSAARDTVPEAVDDAVLTALAKLPADRFASAAEFAQALGGARTPSLATRAARAPAARSGPALRFVAATAVVAAVVLGGLLLRAVRRPDAPVTRLSLDLPDLRVNHQLYIGAAFALSPDGRRLAYIAQPPASPSRLMVRDLADLTPRAIPGTDGADGPFFSPDGKWIAYSSQLKLYKVPVEGGAPVLLASGLTDALSFGAWSTDGKIYFSDQSYALASVPEDGGPTTIVVKPESRAVALIAPSTLPRKDALLVTACNNNCTLIHLMALDLSTGALDTVLSGGSRGWYLPDGRLVVTRQDGTVVAAPFDLKTLRFTETPQVVLTGIQMELGITPEFTVADDGTLVYLTTNQQGTSATVARVDRTGRAAILDSTWTDLFSSFALSPDGALLAVSITKSAASASELWVKQLDRGPLTRLSFDGNLNYRPAWRPGGRVLSFTSDRDSALSYLYEVRADGSSRPLRLFPHDTAQVDEADWSADGTWLVYRTGVSAGLRDIHARRVHGDTTPFPVAAGGYDEYMPALSPDGKWVAYVSIESGREEVYVRPFPDTQRARWQVSTAGGNAPAWSHRGNELYYIEATDSLVSATYAEGSDFTVTGRRALFSTQPFLLLPFHRSYEVWPGDQQFLFLQRAAAGGAEASRLTVVLNWLQELGRQE